MASLGHKGFLIRDLVSCFSVPIPVTPESHGILKVFVLPLMIMYLSVGFASASQFAICDNQVFVSSQFRVPFFERQ